MSFIHQVIQGHTTVPCSRALCSLLAARERIKIKRDTEVCLSNKQNPSTRGEKMILKNVESTSERWKLVVKK